MNKTNTKTKVLNGSYVVGNIADLRLAYHKLSNPLEFQPGIEALLLNSLASKFDILIGNVKFIVARYGSPLSHLAIVAREHKVPVFITTEEIETLPNSGTIIATPDSVAIEIA